MRSNTLLSVAAVAGLAAASPAPQLLDFAQIAAAQTVAVGPSHNGVAVQTASLITTVDVATTASAAVTGASTSAAVQKRDLEQRSIEKRNLWCAMFWYLSSCQSTSTSSVKTTSTSSVKSTSTSSVRTTSTSSVRTTSTSSVRSTFASSVKTTSSSAAAVTSTSSSAVAANTCGVQITDYTPLYVAQSTVTAYTTGTTTISSTSACPTTPEEGTYCGFLNPLDPCGPQPDGYGPVPTPDTVDAFYAYEAFHSMASAAPTTISASPCSGSLATAVASAVPQVYSQTFKDLNASSSAQSYIGLYTLKSYDAAQCAAYCDQTDLCTSFNIYIERDPSVAPSKNDTDYPTVWGYWCPNPASMTSYKCTLWGSNLDASTATNAGQWREDFQVVITGSNGYDRTNVTVPAVPTGTNTNGAGWGNVTDCGSKAIQATNYWMGSKFFPGPYNPQLCGDYAIAQNKQNKVAAQAKGLKSYTPCNMFNSYYLHKNDKPYGTYCALYDTDISTSWATYKGGNSGSDRYDCKQSYKFALNTVDHGVC